MTTTSTDESTAPRAPGAELSIRRVRLEDAAAVSAIVDDDSGLDRNSPYAYVLFAERFHDTFLVAQAGGRIAGFVLALRTPQAPELAFVWQIAVTRAARGRGIAKRLLHALADHGADGAVRSVQATVTPENSASEALFRAFARERGANVEVADDHFPASLFAGGGHARERLFHIEPVRRAHASGPTEESHR